MKTKIRSYTAFIALAMILFNLIPYKVSASTQDEVIYPIKSMSKLDCRFDDFDTLTSKCKQNFLVLKTKDYNKYATQNGGYNNFTRIYTVLWGSSYKYGWDVGSGGHQGVDIATAKGTPVYAIADGKVIESGNNISWGNYISIEHTIRGKKIVSNYAHLSKRDIAKNKNVTVGDKIGEVGSTGNSTGNHLHFQIDLPSTFHPYYYDYTACPYSYYEITEQGVCFDELAKHTLDPLAFLESNGAILDEIESNSVSTTTTSSSSQTTKYNKIFATTVSVEMGTVAQIKEVQQIYKDLGYYTGKISGDFNDVESSVIKYQLDTGVISTKSENGAGWFGPKTRTQTRKDYNAYLANGNVTTNRVVQNTTQTVTTTRIQTVSREKLLTREEIEAQEVQSFLDGYNIKFTNPMSHIDTKDTKTTTLEIKNAKGKGFKGNTPGKISFDYDESKISVFPKSFFNFRNGERDIHITGIKSGHTTLSVKIGDVIVKSFSLSVGNSGDVIGVENAKIYIDSEITFAEANTAIVLMRDVYQNKLVRTKYDGQFDITSSGNVKYCIKKGQIQDIKSVYKRSCYAEEYQDSLRFEYDDTVGGVLIFDYKVLDDTNIVFNVDRVKDSKVLTQKAVKISSLKGLAQNYEYREEVMDTLSAGVTTGIRNGYFSEDKSLTQADAVSWLKNTLVETGDDTEENLSALKKESKQRFTKISREDFLELVYTYLANGEQNTTGRNFRDLDSDKETIVATLLGMDYKWKDGFGETHFQPEKEITRGEAAYLLTQAMETQGRGFLARK